MIPHGVLKYVVELDGQEEFLSLDHRINHHITLRDNIRNARCHGLHAGDFFTLPPIKRIGGLYLADSLFDLFCPYFGFLKSFVAFALQLFKRWHNVFADVQADGNI